MVLGSQTYGAKGTSSQGTLEELVFAKEEGKAIFVIQLCDAYKVAEVRKGAHPRCQLMWLAWLGVQLARHWHPHQDWGSSQLKGFLCLLPVLLPPGRLAWPLLGGVYTCAGASVLQSD